MKKINRSHPVLNKRAFTLIELLTVIVILAIIALIVTPIILNIINDTKDSSNKRSIELYAKAVENAIGRYQINNPGDKDITLEKVQEYIEYKGSKIECETSGINKDGTIYLGKCKIDNKDVEYTYGKKKVTQVYKPQYYWYELTESPIVKIGESSLPENATLIPPERHEFYLGFDVEGDKISKGYACFVRNETEYCLKGYDTEVYNTNAEILKDAYSDVVDTACQNAQGGFLCSAGSFTVGALPDGYVGVYDESTGCEVDDVGKFLCTEY